MRVTKSPVFKTLFAHKRLLAAGIAGVLLLALVLSYLFLTRCSFGLFGYNNPYLLPAAPKPGSISGFTRGGVQYQLNPDVFSVLLLGVDEQAQGATASQADTIFLLSLNKKSGQMDLLPIPRDTVVPVMNYDIYGQYAYTEPGPICTAHSFGTNRMMSGQLMLAATSYLMYNVPVSRFVSINIDAITKIADFVGGVPVTVSADFAEIAGLPAGTEILLSGEMAELYVRGRSLAQMDGSNLSRMVRQRTFLFTLLDVVKQKAKANPLFLIQLYKELAPYMETNLSLHEMAFCGNLGLAHSADMQLHIMEGEMDGPGDEAFYHPDETSLQNYITQIYYLPVV